MYEETIAAANEIKTLASHITALGKIMNKTEDPQLRKLLGDVITSLQRTHANPRAKNKSTPGSLINAQDVGIQKLIAYCQGFVTARKPEWQVLAEHNGWAPKN